MNIYIPQSERDPHTFIITPYLTQFIFLPLFPVFRTPHSQSPIPHMLYSLCSPLVPQL